MTRAALLLVLAGCSGCPSSTPPAASAQAIYGGLVEAGCMADTDGGLAAIQSELAAQPQPPWFSCLADGGSVASCGGCPK